MEQKEKGIDQAKKVSTVDEDRLHNQGIYSIEVDTGDDIIKRYIGSSRNLKQRYSKHKSLLRKGSHDSNILQEAYNKYGRESFSFKFLERNIEISELINRERYYVEKFDSMNRGKGYNKVFPTATLQEYEEEWREMHRRIGWGMHYGEIDSIEKEREYVEWKKAKAEKAQKTAEYFERMKLVQIDKNTGELVKCFAKMNDVVLEMGYKNDKGISKCLTGESRSYKGFVYVYERDYDKRKDYIVESRPKGGYKTKPLYQYDLELNLIKKWDRMRDAVEFGFKERSITFSLYNCGKVEKKFYFSHKEVGDSFNRGYILSVYGAYKEKRNGAYTKVGDK